MGMRLATGPTADFSGITSPSELSISDVIHQANIDVDEKGTVAAAATAVVMSTTGGCGSSQPLKVITLRLDRPFLFMLRDVETGRDPLHGPRRGPVGQVGRVAGSFAGHLSRARCWHPPQCE